MKKDRSSLSALGIAVTRAVESERPADERICYDPYARQMVPGWFYYLTRFFIRSGYTEWRGPGVQGFLVARERYIDDYLEQCIQDGIRQLVLLGAGYDARPYRFPALRGRVQCFEVDHPATQADKRRKLERIPGRLAAEVVFVALDFDRQTLAEALPAHGYRSDRKTLFIWQGVTQYLTAQAIDATLDFVVRHSAPGSALIFDYIYREALNGEGGHNEVANMRRYRRLTEELLTFGFARGSVSAYLEQRGFTAVRDADAETLRALYCTGKNAGRAITNGYGIASALTKTP